MSKRKHTEEVTPEPTFPSFGIHIPRTEYDTPHRAGAQAIWAQEEYNGRKPDTAAILRFLNINKTQGYEIVESDSARTYNSSVEENARGRPPKLDSIKRKEIVDLLNIEHDAQYMTQTQLGLEVGVEATER